MRDAKEAAHRARKIMDHEMERVINDLADERDKLDEEFRRLQKYVEDLQFEKEAYRRELDELLNLVDEVNTEHLMSLSRTPESPLGRLDARLASTTKERLEARERGT